VIPWIVFAVVAVPLVVIGFVATRRRTAVGERPASEDPRERALREQEFAEAEAYEAKWREEDKDRYHQERLALGVLAAIARRPILQLDHDHAQLGLADVLERVRRQRPRPQRGRRPRRTGTRSSVQIYTSVAVVANEVGATQHVLHVRPAVRVDRCRVTGLDPRLENPDALNRAKANAR